MRKEITRVLNDRQKSRGECFFYHHKQTDQIMWGNKEEMTTEMKMWKQLRKDGILQMLEKNCKTKVIDGQTYYILVLQQLKNGVQEPVGIDMLGVGYGFMVDGFISISSPRQTEIWCSTGLWESLLCSNKNM